MPRESARSSARASRLWAIASSSSGRAFSGSSSRRREVASRSEPGDGHDERGDPEREPGEQVGDAAPEAAGGLLGVGEGGYGERHRGHASGPCSSCTAGPSR
jgi:hypothetical protein